MSSRERYQYESASEYETEAEIDDWEVGTGKKGKKQYKKRRAFAETRKLQRWDGKFLSLSLNRVLLYTY